VWNGLVRLHSKFGSSISDRAWYNLYDKNRQRLFVSCYFLASCEKRKHTAHTRQQAASQASTDSAWRHPVWLPHSSLDFRRRTRMCSITQTDATSHNREKRDCGLWVLFVVAALVTRWIQRTCRVTVDHTQRLFGHSYSVIKFWRSG